MIEREFIKNKLKNLNISNQISKVVGKGAACGKITVEKTPLGEKIIVDTMRPGLVIGRGGTTIKKLTTELKSKYALENPQIEVREILKPNLVAAVVARRIADEMERFGPQRFKSMGYRSLSNIMKDGAMGAEIVISGRGIPSQRSKTWRFYAGYLKKCGDIAVSKIDKAIERANLRSGAVGIIVQIMLPGTLIPDHIKIVDPVVKVAEVKESEEKTETKTEESTKKEPVKKEEPTKEPATKTESVKKEEQIEKPATKTEPVKKEEQIEKPATKTEPVKKEEPTKEPATKTEPVKKEGDKK